MHQRCVGWANATFVHYRFGIAMVRVDEYDGTSTLGTAAVPLNFASLLLLTALIATIVPPGYAAYVGAYIAMIVALIAFAIYGWKERTTFTHPAAVATLAAIALVTVSLPFVYKGPQDLLAPVFILPMLTTIALGLLARPGRWLPGPTFFAALCLFAAALALAGGAFERFVLDVYRPGLGNNPIHYATMAAMAGGLSLIGVASGRTLWRYLFLLGPVFGIGATVIAGSRGPMAGALAMALVGLVALTVWLWRERMFRWFLAAAVLIGATTLFFLVGAGNHRGIRLADTALNIFRITGGTDDIRAALYISSVHAFASSPFYGHGFGQLMQTVQAMFPEQSEAFTLENLHADWANLSVMAGSLGLSAYFLLLAAPLLLLVKPEARRDRAIVLGALLLTTGQFTLGISNAMFGVLPQTMVYAVSTGYLLMHARRINQECDAASH